MTFKKRTIIQRYKICDSCGKEIKCGEGYRDAGNKHYHISCERR